MPSLDTVGERPETAALQSTAGAAETLANSSADTPADDGVSALVTKLEKLVAMQAAAVQAQAEAAVVRSRLGQAVMDALAGRAQAQARARAELLRRYRLGARARQWRLRRGGISRRIDRALAKLRFVGGTLVIARSGLWRPIGSGPAAILQDLMMMAAYARRGPSPISPPAILDQPWYLARYPDVAVSGLSPLVHYLVARPSEMRAPHPLFDPAFYLRHSGGAVAASGLTPLQHFINVGAALGLDPHPLFSLEHYVSQAPELADTGENPLTHYLTTGWRAGLSPHPLFAPAFYAGQLGEGELDRPALVHYLVEGSERGLKPHPLVDPSWYRAEYPDVVDSGFEPLTHFVLSGAEEGRSPSAWFDAPHYVALRGGALPPGVNPLVDYLLGGAWSVGEPRPGFPTAAYVVAKPEIARTGVTPLEHWAMLSQHAGG